MNGRVEDAKIFIGNTTVNVHGMVVDVTEDVRDRMRWRQMICCGNP